MQPEVLRAHLRTSRDLHAGECVKTVTFLVAKCSVVSVKVGGNVVIENPGVLNDVCFMTMNCVVVFKPYKFSASSCGLHAMVRVILLPVTPVLSAEALTFV